MEKLSAKESIFDRKDYHQFSDTKSYTYDIECTASFFCVVFKHDTEYNVFVISNERNEVLELIAFLKNNVTYLKGYNNISYDSQLLEFIQRHKFVTAKNLYEFSQTVIDSELPIYYQTQIYNVDIYRILHLNNANRRIGLKWCEYMLDWHNLEDMPHHHSKDLTIEEQIDTINYCFNDVDATDFIFQKNEKELDIRRKLTNMFNIDFTNASYSKIGSELLLNIYCKETNKDPQTVKKLRTPRDKIYLKDILVDYIKFDSEAFSRVLENVKKTVIIPNNKDSTFSYSTTHKGFQFDYGLGGIHGSLSNTIVEADNYFTIKDGDVGSFYPSFAIQNKLFPEHLGFEFYNIYNKNIVAVRLAEKAKGKDGNGVIVAGYKEASNSCYGKSNESTSWLYDPKYTYTTTINCQLLLSMLAEKLMEIPESTLIQINTDGLTVKYPRKYEELYNSICNNWEKLTRLSLEYAEYSKMMIRDVNSYIAVYTNGKAKCKGSFEFENLPLHKNKSSLVVRKALFNWFVNNIPIEQTILNHENVLDFCIGIKAKAGAKLIYLDKQGSEFNLSKTIRYYVAKKGVVVKKRFNDGRTQYLNVHPQKGRTYRQTLLNKFTKESLQEALNNIDYSYYLNKTREELYSFHKITLF